LSCTVGRDRLADVTTRFRELMTMRVDIDARVARITIDAPPINLMTPAMTGELLHVTGVLATADDVGAVVLRSANPDFFIAHFDVAALLAMPIAGEPQRPTEHNAFHVLCERLRTMPKATIAMIAGRVGGGGAELAASCDMRFGALDRMVLNQMEVPLGILPGGTGTQRLPWLVGRGRAAEIMLGGIDVDAHTAADWGWLNRALPADDLAPYVDQLAARIVSFPPGAVAEAKASLLAAGPDPAPGLLQEEWRLQRLLRTDAARGRMRAFLVHGGQTAEGERRLEQLVSELE
jgi:enoyl-CoA hydratase/carnithine racemase